MYKVGIIVNPERDPGLKYLGQLIDLLNRNQYECVVSCGNFHFEGDYAFSTPEECFDGSSVVLTLGGDGTLLRAAAYAHQYNVPLLGVNLGHLGFLAELESDELDQLPKILSEGFECTERMMLNVSVIRNNETIIQNIALNDAVIRSKNGKPTHIVLSDKKNDLLEYFCDGFIVATPTGSTAYSMSAGGPILEPQSDAIVVTPICPHTLGSRPVVFGASKKVIEVRVLNAEKILPVLECDGGEVTELLEGDFVRIVRHSNPLRLVKLKDKSFYKVLNEKISRRFS